MMQAGLRLAEHAVLDEPLIGIGEPGIQLAGLIEADAHCRHLPHARDRDHEQQTNYRLAHKMHAAFRPFQAYLRC